MPENYLIAKQEIGQRWIADPDLAANKKLALKVFVFINESFGNRYTEGDQICKILNQEN